MITGILENRWKYLPPAEGQKPVVEMVLLAKNVEVLNKREFNLGNEDNSKDLNEFKQFWMRHNQLFGGKILVESVCPSIYERQELKLGILLALIGGVN